MNFLVIIESTLGVSMEHILNIFHSHRELLGGLLVASWERVNFVKDDNEHKAQGSTREKLTFALSKFCLIFYEPQ